MKKAQEMQSDPGHTVTGLTADDVASRRLTWDWNKLPRMRRTHPLRVLSRQFTGLLVAILIIAAGIAFYLGQRIDALAIAMVVILNAALETGRYRHCHGQRGTEVARDAADLVLLDDNFATVVAAIREGRREFDNVQKFVRYFLSSNAGEIVTILTSIMIGGPLIFLATQILWMNLVTDSVTAVASGLEKSEPAQMRRPPEPINARVLWLKGAAVVVLIAAYTGTASLWIFYQLLPMGVDVARTAAFTGMIEFKKVSVFAFRSLDQPCPRIGWFSNPLLIGAVGVTLLVQVGNQCNSCCTRTFDLGSLDQNRAFCVALIVVPELVRLALPKRVAPNDARPTPAN